MFEDLFVDHGAIAFYRAAPLLEERLNCLRHCAESVRPWKENKRFTAFLDAL